MPEILEDVRTLLINQLVQELDRYSQHQHLLARKSSELRRLLTRLRVGVPLDVVQTELDRMETWK